MLVSSTSPPIQFPNNGGHCYISNPKLAVAGFADVRHHLSLATICHGRGDYDNVSNLPLLHFTVVVGTLM
jgi:hypothetical protein